MYLYIIIFQDDDRRRGGITLGRYQELYAEFLGNPEETPAVYLFGPLSEFFYNDDPDLVATFGDHLN